MTAICLRFSLGKEKHDIAFPVSIKWLTLWTQTRTETCGRSSPIEQVCYSCATKWFWQDHFLWELCNLKGYKWPKSNAIDCGNSSLSHHHQRAASVKRSVSMGSCLRKEGELVEGHGFTQVLSYLFCRTSSVFWLHWFNDTWWVILSKQELILSWTSHHWNLLKHSNKYSSFSAVSFP